MTGVYSNQLMVQLVVALSGREVTVTTVDNHTFKGVLAGMAPEVSKCCDAQESYFRGRSRSNACTRCTRTPIATGCRSSRS